MAHNCPHQKLRNLPGSRQTRRTAGNPVPVPGTSVTAARVICNTRSARSSTAQQARPASAPSAGALAQEVAQHRARLHAGRLASDTPHLDTAVDVVGSSGRSTGGLNARITSSITASTSWQQAFTIFVHYSDAFNGINTAALIGHIAKLLHAHRRSGRVMSELEWEELREALAELHDFAEAELPRLGPRELSNTAYGLSRLGILSRRFTQLLLARAQPHTMNNKELCGLLVALAHAQPHACDPMWFRGAWYELTCRARTLSHQELCNGMWALARLHSNPGPAMLHTCVLELQHRAPYLAHVDIANAMWALATLQYRPADAGLLAPLLATCADQACSTSPRHVSTMLWAVAAGGWATPPAWVSVMAWGLSAHVPVGAAESAAAEDAAQQDPSTVTTSQEHPPPSASISGGTRGTSGRGTAPQQSRTGQRVSTQHPQEWGDGLPSSTGQHQWAGADMHALTAWQDGNNSLPPECCIEKPPRVKDLQGSDERVHEVEPGADTPCDLAQRGTYRMTPRDASMALHALARMQHPRSPQVVREFVHVVLSGAEWNAAPQDVVSCVWATAHLGHTMSPQQLGAVLASTTVRLHEYTPRQVAGLCTALARHGARPPLSWLRSVCRHVLHRLELWGPREVANLAWALAGMRQQVSGRMARLLLEAVLIPGAAGCDSLAQAVTLREPVPPPRPVAGLSATGVRQGSAGAVMSPGVHPTPAPPAVAAAVARAGAASHSSPYPAGNAAAEPRRHQQLANMIWALPLLLQPGRLHAFGSVNRDLLVLMEAATLHTLPPAHLPSGGGANGSARQRPMGWQACELLQVLQGFAMLGHRPSSDWLDAHFKQAAGHWPHLTPKERRRAVYWYRLMAGTEAAQKFVAVLRAERAKGAEGLTDGFKGLSGCADRNVSGAVQTGRPCQEPVGLRSSVLPFTVGLSQ